MSSLYLQDGCIIPKTVKVNTQEILSIKRRVMPYHPDREISRDGLQRSHKVYLEVKMNDGSMLFCWGDWDELGKRFEVGKDKARRAKKLT